ncbi:serine/threonine-protein kinase [Actinomadura hibisca]|uniref:serine/threonine-protein kinase n=1 Tax=Actinomadura hibisca TaxID=68565 RepID=UPI00082CA47D|nr:serine/threonine-protein kinase [Actinomadura hibisca]
MRALRDTDPRQAGPYRLLAEVGRGGMGRVLLGVAPDGRLVAVKQIHARLAADAGFRARFRREVDASRRVSGAYTAAVMDADPDGPAPWLASAFVAGPSLGEVVDALGPLPEPAVRVLAAGLAAALTEIHRTGLVHRDLKPDNVLLAEDGVRVIDFGIARAAEGGDATELTRTGWVVGSPAFMSPEQADGREPSPAGDVFSLGAVLALAATGASPFAGASTARTLYNVVHADPDLSAVPPSLRPIVAACLAKDPAARPTPEQLRDLVGPVPPAAPRWPPRIHQMAQARQAEIAGLLGDPDRTLVPGGPVQAPTRVAEQAATRIAPPGAMPTIGTPAARRRPTAALLAAGAGALSLAVVAAVYVVTSGGAAANGSFSSDPDRYTKAPICSEAAPKLPLPPRSTDRDAYSERSDEAETSCEWGASSKDRWAPRAHTTVRWRLERSIGGRGNGTDRQRREFADLAKDGERESGIGEEAFWDTTLAVDDHCDLSVRDGNLQVTVTLGGDQNPPATCKDKARTIVRAALAAMPR